MNTTYTFEQLKDDVRKEAEALRVHATSEELGRLSIDSLNPENMDNCIYGQITGNCHSVRAKELIKECAPKFVIDRSLCLIKEQGVSRIQCNIQKDDINNFNEGRGWEGYYTVLEAYILLPEAKNANLIAFLRGETETLEL